MTFSQRRRLCRIGQALVLNSTWPFLLGVSLSLVLQTSAVVETFKEIDKSGLSLCSIPSSQKSFEYQSGVAYGKSQCYPYAVPYSEAQGQGGVK